MPGASDLGNKGTTSWGKMCILQLDDFESLQDDKIYIMFNETRLDAKIERNQFCGAQHRINNLMEFL